MSHDDASPHDATESRAAANLAAQRGWLGTAALAFGALLIGLSLIEGTTGLPFRMPRSWYAQPTIWHILALGSLAAGYVLLRQRTHLADDDWEPARRGRRFRRLVLYTRDGCHLCDVARDAILKYARWLPPLEEIDVDDDPALVERFGTSVPVVELDGRVRFRGRVNEFALRRLIEGSATDAETDEESSSPS